MASAGLPADLLRDKSRHVEQPIESRAAGDGCLDHHRADVVGARASWDGATAEVDALRLKVGRLFPRLCGGEPVPVASEPGAGLRAPFVAQRERQNSAA